VQRWLRRYWPSTRLRRDPLRDLRVDARYAPVSIANWKLTPAMRDRILALRVPRPLDFSADRRLTLVIPFRDRDAHLRQLLPPLTSTLREQRLSFRVLVVEQEPGGLFNRGKLINIGMQHAAEVSDYYCLHDVDAVPVVANYACPSQPLRLVSKILGDEGEAHRTDYYFSGAISIRKEQAFAANGYSNEYWGWGKEDDDFFFRLLLAGYLCFYDTLGTYHDLPNPKHQQVVRKSPATPPHVRINRERRSQLLRGLLDPAQDGLSTLRYEVLSDQDFGDHQRIKVRW
jgi:N-terminal region of glycosyl transferase group 7/N-terminal domain of galactosyltransferase